MKKYIPFLCFWLLNSIILYLSGIFFPKNIVLGNVGLSTIMATFVAGFAVAVIGKAIKPIFKKVGLELFKRSGIKLGREHQKFLFYWGANSVAIWLAARFSFLLGFGISSYIWALGLGLALNLIQWACWLTLKKKKLV